jgi:uncharacterized protein involved in outer membrane biogenesis
MKKVLKISGLVILGIFVLMLVLPVVFKKPIQERIQQEMDSTVKARVNFNLGISLIRNFPDLTLDLKNLSVVGIEEFEKDTLIAFRSFRVRINLISAIKMENIDVKAVVLDHPYIKGKILANGKANWDIMRDTSTSAETDTSVSEPTKFSVNLKKVEVISGSIIYDDAESNMSADIRDFNFLMRGNLADDFTTLDITTSAQAVTFVMDGIKYLRKASFTGKAGIEADMNKYFFKLKDNEFSLNELGLALDGTFAMPGDSMLFDLKFGSRNNSFKSLLSLVPAVYMEGFEQVQTSGEFSLNGDVKGLMYDTILPSVNLAVTAQNGMFKYPDLPASVEKIALDMKLFFDGENNDRTTVDINKFHMELAGNPFDMMLKVRTPMSDPAVEGSFVGKIDLGNIMKVVPLDSTEMAGIIESDIRFAGTMSMLDKEQYEQFKADGLLTMTGVKYKSPDVPAEVLISDAALGFTPRFLDLKSFNMKMGKSDFSLSGKITDFIPYAFADKTVKADFRFTSSLIDANELMGTSADTAVVAEDTTAMTVIEIPKNIAFRLTSSLGKVVYENMEITNINGVIETRDGMAILDKVKMNMLQGLVEMNGNYDTRDLSKPAVDFGLKLTDVDITSCFKTFVVVGKFAPVAEHAKGKISAGLSFKSLLDQQMNPVYPSVSGAGNLNSKQIELGDSKVFSKLADALKYDKLRQVSVKDISIDFEIREGRVFVKPFTTKIGNTALTAGGDQGLDQSLNYALALTLPRGEMGSAAMGSLQAMAGAKGINLETSPNVNVKVKVGGTFSNPDVKPDLAGSGENMVQSVKEQAKAVVEEKKQEVKAKVNEEAQKILAQADAEARRIRDAAKTAADLEKSKANQLADQTIQQAAGKPKFAQDLAKKTADKIRKEGEDKALKITTEADKKAEAVLTAAREQADKLK